MPTHVDPIVSFYALKATDHRGRRLQDMWMWDDDTLEGVHDYIQWMFPTEQASAFNPDAPQVRPETRAAFAADAALRANLTRSLDRMLAFYGFERRGEAIEKSTAFDARSRKWLTPGNHNHLRMTRILDSLALLSLPQFAVSLFGALDDVYAGKYDAISQTTYQFWRAMADRARRNVG
jgi:Opioid growth factor receptor (OGFr) conserved region